jgi:thioesterase domain-containing protein/acyl carrier protein
VVAAIWCRALGLAEVAPDAEFAALGGDSLTSIHLLARLRDRLGVELRLADFARAPSLTGLTRLVEDALGHRTVRDRSPYAIALQAHGARPPLFCVAPAAGSPLCYRDLAARLGPDQPFYGLEARGLHDGQPPLRRIEDMATAHLEAVRSIQPRGPYLLAGWSFGAILGHEMAHQLERLGEQVALLACLDAVVPDTGGRPYGAMPGFLVRTLWRQVRFFLELRVPRQFDELAYVAAWLGIRLTDRDASGVTRSLARTIHELRSAVTNVPRFAEVYNANLRAILRYVPQPITCPIVIFKTEVDGDLRKQATIAAATRPLVRGPVELVPVAGNHMTMLDPRHVASLATALRAVLDRTAPRDATGLAHAASLAGP